MIPGDSHERTREGTLSGGGALDPVCQSRPCVLVLADDPIVIEVLSRYLDRADLGTAFAQDGPAALELVRRVEPELVVLDMTLPGLDGSRFCQDVRSDTRIPVIALTSLDDADVPGVEDCVTTPFSPRELVSRIQAVLDRRSFLRFPRATTELVAGALVADEASRVASKDGQALDLSDREFELLVFLLRNPGRVFRRDELIRGAWGYGSEDVSTTASYVRLLREKIEEDPARPRMLVTAWGAGYRFDPPGSSVAATS